MKKFKTGDVVKFNFKNVDNVDVYFGISRYFNDGECGVVVGVDEVDPRYGLLYVVDNRYKGTVYRYYVPEVLLENVSKYYK